MRFFEGALGVGFLVEGFGFGDGGGSALFLVLFGGRPVDERGRKFFPLVALSAFVADAVAFHFILRDQLVGAVFEDEAAGAGLRGGAEGKTQHSQGDSCKSTRATVIV